MIPGGRYAFQVFRPAAPVLRVRYRDGVLIGPHGFPDWLPYARVVLELPPWRPDLGTDGNRVLDVVTANLTMADTGDPLWQGPGDHGTPTGWAWAHLAMSRQVALVPVELHGSFRHLGGVSTTPAGPARRGPDTGDGGAPPRLRYDQRLAGDAVVKLEEYLGHRLPEAYRGFLAGTNGGRPDPPAVHPGYGFLVDQPFFGLARRDRAQDLAYANAWFGDRLTPDWLAVGYVQGGLIAVRVRGGDEGSVWYLDDDDRRDADEYTAADVCERLLHRCADDFAAFWRALRPVPAWLLALAADVTVPRVSVVESTRAGAALPPRQREVRV